MTRMSAAHRRPPVTFNQRIQFVAAALAVAAVLIISAESAAQCCTLQHPPDTECMFWQCSQECVWEQVPRPTDTICRTFNSCYDDGTHRCQGGVGCGTCSVPWQECQAPLACTPDAMPRNAVSGPPLSTDGN